MIGFASYLHGQPSTLSNIQFEVKHGLPSPSASLPPLMGTETLGPIKVFRMWAWAFSSRGMPRYLALCAYSARRGTSLL